MFGYIIRRLIMLFPVIIGISFMAFTLGELAPGDAAGSLYQQLYGQPAPSQAAIEEIREQFGLNDPFAVRFARWTIAAVQGDLGNSFRTGRPVLDELSTRFTVTLRLSVGGLIVALLIAVPAGILAAMYHNSVVDLGTRFLSLLGATIPAFWLAYMLILLFSVRLRWLPVAGFDSWRHMVLPWLALGLGGAAAISRLLRSSMLEILGTDFVRTARAKGGSEYRVSIRHAFRNALIPLVTLMGALFGFLTAGAVVVETVFAIPGFGRLILDAIFFRDIPVIQAFVVFTGILFVLINLMVDITYTWIDPRIRLTARGGTGE
ncbi:MAG: ABC transporter permease [Anaerolineales bacterium]|nr:ABC transporter permease [Anaerolineales bacterium]